MGQRPRDIAPGIQHITVGATGEEAYYLDEADRMVWTRRFVRTLDRFAWTCISLCQLTTHVHAIVDIPDDSLARGMHYLNVFYGKHFNEKNGRRGNLIRARYGSKRIVDDEQFIAAFRYVARNPVRAGLCERAEDWSWSSFATSCGLAETFSFIDRSIILATVRATEASAAPILRALVRDDAD
jgi:putative transposase